MHSANPALNNRFANVCNLQFWVGENARTCTYCYNAPPQFVCERYGNQTVLLVGGVMVRCCCFFFLFFPIIDLGKY